MREQWIVITGDPMSGLFFTGPFSNADDAVAYAESNCHKGTWWISRMAEPLT
jgi:hypothetical protein